MLLQDKQKKISSAINTLSGVGSAIAKRLAKLNIHSIPDLLFHFPLRYQDRTQLQAIRTLRPGDEAVIEGIIQVISQPKRGRTKFLCQLLDETGLITLRFFHILPFHQRTLKIGTRLRCYSEVKLGPQGLEMFHPEFEIIKPGQRLTLPCHLTPIYPATEGLSQYLLRKLTSQALAWMDDADEFAEYVPIHLMPAHTYPSLKEALTFLHRPPQQTAITQLMEQKTLAHQRIIFEELLAHRLSLLKLKNLLRTQAGIPLTPTNSQAVTFRQSLPFQLTTAQQRVIAEINADLTQPHPMLRLIQGDVGSGKTVVAALAVLQAVNQGYQAAIMAPTELLAEQHYRVFQHWLTPLHINLAYLSSHLKASVKADMLKNIASGGAQVIIGTHALFQKSVEFAKLALIVVDEQHRFGVHQRVMLREKGLQADVYPHQLMMTATPIPRTLAMSIYADLDCSTIDELPPGRTPIVTRIIANSRRDEVIERIKAVCEQGRQAYWVCPLIDESEAINCQAAIQQRDYLQKMLSNLRVGLIHGRLSALEKETVMRSFQSGELHVLVATTVIEVGVDVPNASIIVIENAERLGLSQLHQLRGRVGRGNIASHCLLLYQHPLSELAKARLSVIRDTNDGFKIAQRDLELRGPGDVFGTRQTGDLIFRMVDLRRDQELFAPVELAATAMMRDYPQQISKLLERWLFGREHYGDV